MSIILICYWCWLIFFTKRCTAYWHD
jgi:hypothetical protein